MTKTFIMILAIMFICLSLFLIVDPNSGIGNGGINNNVSVVEGTLTVNISGEVLHPGSYILSEGATLNELINAAGGTTDKADPKAYVLSCPLEDNMSYYIAPKVTSTDICEPVTITKVNINTATKEELMSVQGVGAAIAQAIVDYREQNGPFNCLEDLLKVNGIGNATFERIKDYICLS